MSVELIKCIEGTAVYIRCVAMCVVENQMLLTLIIEVDFSHSLTAPALSKAGKHISKTRRTKGPKFLHECVITLWCPP